MDHHCILELFLPFTIYLTLLSETCCLTGSAVGLLSHKHILLLTISFLIFFLMLRFQAWLEVETVLNG